MRELVFYALVILGVFVNVADATPLIGAINTTSPTVDFDVNLGAEFTAVGVDIIIDSLGFWDQNQDGLAESHRVGIWRVSDQTLMVSGTVPAGTTATLVGEYRYVNVGNTILQAGTAYILAGHSENALDARPFQGSIIWSVAIVGNFSNQGAFLGSSSFVYPSNVSSTLRGPANANFSPVPEPSACALALVGVAVLGLRWRKRRKAAA